MVLIYSTISCVLLPPKGCNFFLSLLHHGIQWFLLPKFQYIFLSFASPYASSLCSPLANLLTRLRMSTLTAFSASNERQCFCFPLFLSFFSPIYGCTQLPIVCVMWLML